MYAYTQNNPIMYNDESGFLLKEIVGFIAQNLEIKKTIIFWELFESIHKEVNSSEGSKGNGGISRMLFLDLEGPNVSNIGFTLLDVGLGFITCEQDFSGFDFGLDLFSAEVKAGLNQNLIGLKAMASVFDFRGEFEIPIGNQTLVVGGEFNFLAIGATYKYEEGKISFGWAYGIGGSFTIGIE